MKKLLSDWFTEPDNKTWCLVKAATGAGVLTFLGCSVVHTVFNKTFDYQSFGLGFGAIVSLCGSGMLMKKDSQQQGEIK